MRAALISLLCCSACIAPRSISYGQMASGVGRGATEVGVMTGFMYASQTTPPVQTSDGNGGTTTSQTTTRGFAMPAFEANLEHGFTRKLGLSVHASSAGLQPGIKITVTDSRVVHFALLPSVALGYGSLADSQFTAGSDGLLRENNPSTTTSFSLLTGLKFIFSHQSGFYLGAGYDFMYTRSFRSGVVGAIGAQDKVESLTTAGHHVITGAAGFSITLGMLRLRPEVAFSVTPGITSTTTTAVGATTTAATAFGGSAWAILPGFTVAIATPAQARPADDEATESVKDSDSDTERTDDGDSDSPRHHRQNPDDEDEGPRRIEKKAPKRASED